MPQVVCGVSTAPRVPVADAATSARAPRDIARSRSSGPWTGQILRTPFFLVCWFVLVWVWVGWWWVGGWWVVVVVVVAVAAAAAGVVVVVVLF